MRDRDPMVSRRDSSGCSLASAGQRDAFREPGAGRPWPERKQPLLSVGRPARLVALAVSGVLLCAGCGGAKAPSPAATTGAGTAGASTVASTAVAPLTHPSKAAYDRVMMRYGQTLAESVNAMYPLVDGPVGSQAASLAIVKVKKVRVVVTNVRAALARIVAPAPIRTDHEKLVGYLGHLDDQLDALIGVLQHGSTKPFGLYTALNALDDVAYVTGDMRKKGYAVG
jgi:hypothetical protein